jgi:cytochrome P450
VAGQSDEHRRQREQARSDLKQYMAGLVEHRRELPGDDLLSGLATDTGPRSTDGRPLPHRDRRATAVRRP